MAKLDGRKKQLKSFRMDKNTLIKNKVYDKRRRTEIEIGDEKEPNRFIPQFKTKHWDNECNFSIRLIDEDFDAGIVRQAEDKIEWERNGRIARFYEKDTNDEDGGFEFEVELLSKPTDNVLDFSIRSKELDFFYQPPLDQEPLREGETATATEIRNASGKVVARRPEDVIGSYAVYHKTKTGDKYANKNYRTGKAFHIYRPFVEDAEGTKAWCDLTIDQKNKKLSVTIPQDFLDNAVYPVIVDPTFGYTTIGGSTRTDALVYSETGARYDQRAGYIFTAPEAGTLDSLSFYAVPEWPFNARGIVSDRNSGGADIHDEIDKSAQYSGESFPVVEGSATGRETSTTTSHPITMPGSIATGELLIVVFSCDGNPTITVGSGTGWTEYQQRSNSTATTQAIYYKIADGSDTLTLTTGGSEASSHVSMRISGASGFRASSSTGSDSNPNPPNNNLMSRAKNYLWLATSGNDSDETVTAVPTNYTEVASIDAGTILGAGTSVARRNLNAASEDPGTFTLDGSEQWVAFTICVIPDPEFDDTNGWRTVDLTDQSIVASDVYILNAIGDADIPWSVAGGNAEEIGMAYDSGTSGEGYEDGSGAQSYTAPEDPWTRGSFESSKYSIYATYTATGGTPANAERDAEVHGVDTANSSRSAEISGGLNADDSRSAEIDGEAAPVPAMNYLIRRNDAETDALAESTNFDSTWDTEVASEGSDITYSGGTFTLAAGKYLIMYAERWETSDTTNNTRLEIQGRILVDTVEQEVGAGQCYIRKSSGQQEGIVHGAGIFDFSSETDIDIRFYRTDSSTTVDPTRTPDWGGVQIIKLSDDWNYGRYSLSSNTAANTSESVWATVAFDTNDEQDTGFSNSSGVITVTNARKYLVAFSLPLSHTSGSGRTEYGARLAVNGSQYEGTWVSTYLRGNESTQDGVLTFIGIIDVGASETIEVENLKREGTNSTFGAGGNLQIVELPSDAKTFRRTATSGDMNTISATEFSWDVTEFEDTDTFTINSATDSFTEVDEDGDYLFFASLEAEEGNRTRSYPTLRFSVNDTIQQYSAAGEYGRNTGTADNPGFATGIFLPGLTAGDDISVETLALGAGSSVINDHGSFSGIRLDSLFAAGGTDVNDERDAEVTGQVSDNDSRDSEIHGQDSAQASRDAEITGIEGANDARDAELHGEATASANRDAEITGSVTVNDSRSAEIEGSLGSDAARGAEIHGIGTTNNSRSAEVEGSLGSNDSRSAEIQGVDNVVDSVDSEIHGQDTANTQRDAQVYGSANVTDSRDSEISGQDTAVSGRSSEITGQSTDSDSRDAQIHGELSTDNNRDAEIFGSDTDVATRSAEISGQGTGNDTRSAEIDGTTAGNDSRDAEITGTLASGSSRGAEILGGGIDPYCPTSSPYTPSDSPYSAKANPFTSKTSPYSGKTSPYEKFQPKDCS